MRCFSHHRSRQTTQLYTYLFMDSVPRPHRFVYFLQYDSAKCHIPGQGDPVVGPMTPEFERGQDFVQCN